MSNLTTVTMQPLATFTDVQRRLILDTCFQGASEQEALPLIAMAEQRGLNPLDGDCYFVKRWDRQKGREIWAVQASIDSFRKKAEDTGLYGGQDEPEFTYKDDRLICAKVRVYRKDWDRPMTGIAFWDEYAQLTKDGRPTSFWSRMPHNQLSKCAEALALRKAFPRHFAKIYTPDEMAQASNEEPRPKLETWKITDDGEVVANRSLRGESLARKEITDDEEFKYPSTLTESERWALTEAFVNAKTMAALKRVGLKVKELVTSGRMSEAERVDAEKLYRSQELKIKMPKDGAPVASNPLPDFDDQIPGT